MIHFKNIIYAIFFFSYKVHSSKEVPDGISMPHQTRFQLFADYNKARNSNTENQRSRLLELEKPLQDLNISIHGKEVEYQKMKTIKTFQTNLKAVEESLKLLETEIASLREVYPVCTGLEIKDFMESLALLKANETDLRRIAEILHKIQYLNEEIIKIDLTVEALKKKRQKNHHNVLIQGPNMTEINSEVSLLKAEIDDAILLSIDRAPFHLLHEDDGFTPSSQFIATTLNPGLRDEYADINIIGLRFDSSTQVDSPILFLNNHLCINCCLFVNFASRAESSR